MIKNHVKKILFWGACILFSFQVNAQQKHRYIENNRALASELSQQYGIPSAVMLAVAFVETGGGSSRAAKTFNNHFGIVGKNHVTKSRYKSFTSKKESFIAFCKLLSRKKYYAALKGNSNYHKWIEEIAAAGYSVQPTEWKRRIHLIINTYGLDK